MSTNVLNAYYDELAVGDKFHTRARTITEADLVFFSGWSGDYSALHTDEEYAKAGPFGKRIAHGCLTLSVGTGLEFALMSGDGPEDSIVAFYGMDRVRFVKPVFIGDTVHIEGEVIALEPKDDTRGVVTLREEIKNQDGVTVAVLDKRTLRIVKSASTAS